VPNFKNKGLYFSESTRTMTTILLCRPSSSGTRLLRAAQIYTAALDQKNGYAGH